MQATYVIVGGGIAGVTCAETLAFLEPAEPIILISESALIKRVINLHAITRTLQDFDIEEKEAGYLAHKHLNITVIHDHVIAIDDVGHTVATPTRSIKYKFLCICTGATPSLIPQAEHFKEEIVGIRDTDSVEKFVAKLKGCRKIVVVGNGGIASELVHKLENVEVHWVVKDKHISATFVDPGAAEFFQSALLGGDKGRSGETVSKRMRYSEGEAASRFKSGAALGPDWYKNLVIAGNAASGAANIEVHYEEEVAAVERIEGGECPVAVTLSGGKKIHCDLVVSATGVHAKSDFHGCAFAKSEDGGGGIKVDEFMRTSRPDIYAAGDVCSATWDPAKHWFQMKLWTQARQMGCYAAKSMAGHAKGEVVLQDFCFEMFAHSTKLFGYKVILLGLFNGQKLGTDYEILLRTTRDLEYVKLVLQNGKMQGAVLVGDTDLEEMCENLILDQLDLTPFGDDILDPNIDIDDYFD